VPVVERNTPSTLTLDLHHHTGIVGDHRYQLIADVEG
jgi:hypothetical protein